MWKTFSGVCPYTNDTQRIQIEYQYVATIQTLSQNYQKMGLHCDRECPSDIKCPIYKQAPRSITE